MGNCCGFSSEGEGDAVTEPNSQGKAPQKSLRFLVIGQLQNRCRDAFYFFGGRDFFSNREIRDTGIRGDQISHILCMVAKRGLINRANVHTPMWKSRLKHSTAEFQSIQQFWLQFGHRFIAKTRKLTTPTRESETTHAETINQRRFCFWPKRERARSHNFSFLANV